jgi:dTMP kinase
LFITFEGIDGCGKSTQVRLFYDYLVKHNFDVVLTREPGGTETAERIRDIILDPKSEIDPMTEILLYTASRSQHYYSKIKKALDGHYTVLCDRYIDSSIAIQGYGNGSSINDIRIINDIAVQGFSPDITFLIDLDPEVAASRMQKRELDRIEQRGVDFQKRVRNGYLVMADSDPLRFIVVDGSLSPDKVQQQIQEEFEWRRSHG